MVLTWDEVLERDWGDLTFGYGGVFYRGPLLSIQLEGRRVLFKTKWLARKVWLPPNAVWNAHFSKPTVVYTTVARYLPRVIGGTLRIERGSGGEGVLYPKGEEPLDRGRVVGW